MPLLYTNPVGKSLKPKPKVPHEIATKNLH